MVRLFHYLQIKILKTAWWSKGCLLAEGCVGGIIGSFCFYFIDWYISYIEDWLLHWRNMYAACDWYLMRPVTVIVYSCVESVILIHIVSVCCKLLPFSTWIIVWAEYILNLYMLREFESILELNIGVLKLQFSPYCDLQLIVKTVWISWKEIVETAHHVDCIKFWRAEIIVDCWL